MEGKIIIYCRESRDNGGYYERIETQRDILVAFCKSRELGRIVDIVMDDNVSGTDFSRLEPVKERIRRGEADTFVCKDASRLGRNLLDSLRFIEFMDNHGARLIFESEQYNEDMFPLIAWFNERRAKDDSQKIRRVLKHKMQTGEMVIKAPYGYIKRGNTLVPDERAAETVREIFGLFADGMSRCAIAEILNKKGAPTPSQLKHGDTAAASWNRQHIDRIVRHVAYSGDMPYGMREKASYKSKKYISKPREEWIIIRDHHEPIVDRELFDRAQRRIGTRGRYERKAGGVFSGLVFCGRCGGKIYSKSRGRMICYKNNTEGGVKADGRGCGAHTVREDDLLAYVGEYISGFIRDPGFRSKALKELGAGKELRRLGRRRQELLATASRVYDDRLSGTLPEFLLRNKLEEITAELDRLTAEEEVLKSAAREDGLSVYKTGITNDNISMLFKKIIVFEPNDITVAHMEEYALSAEEYENLSKYGGVLFVQNFRYTPGKRAGVGEA